MNCHEFEDRWNDVLDARSAGLPELERSLEAHSATCERCQAVSARYQLLRQAVAAWGPIPAPSAASVDRLRRLTVAPARRPILGRLARVAIPLATAAAVLLLVWFEGPWRANPPDRPQVPVAITRRVEPSRPIETALEEATTATIDLAREASAPAARIGRDVFRFESSGDPLEESTAEPEVTITASDLLQSVGERVNAQVKPISGSARHAFSFLLGPPPATDRRQGDPSDLTR